MKVIKLIIIFVVILSGVIGVLFLLTDGEKDVPAPSSDTNVLPDTTAIGDTAIIEDVTDKDKLITSPQDEKDNEDATQERRLKAKQVVDPSESKQSKKAASEKKITNPSERKKEAKHKFTCPQCGTKVWFNTQKELDCHIASHHCER